MFAPSLMAVFVMDQPMTFTALKAWQTFSNA
jgi:hypothetical protein